MRGISEDELINIADQLCTNERLIIYDRIVAECRELQEPWMTLDEFLKSEFDGLCWVFTEDSKATLLEFIGDGFFDIADHFRIHHKTITHVMPIHKPEPPR